METKLSPNENAENIDPIRAINDTLAVLTRLHNKELDKYLSQNNGVSALQVGGKTFLEIDEKSIRLIGGDITQKISPSSNTQNSPSISPERIRKFFEVIKDFILRLNHLGISYSCPSIEIEVAKIKKSLEGTDFKLYEERAEFTHQRWFFIGNLENWEYPLFELVITESVSPISNKWLPHFQIDIDTNLGAEELEALISEHLKENFVDWKYDIPDYGVVLEMGELSNTNGTKIYLGIGTNLRKTKSHREKILQLV